MEQRLTMTARDCFHAKELIDYCDGNLTETKKQQFINHLAICERCARNLKTLTQVDELLKIKDKKITSDWLDNLASGEQCIGDDLLYQYLDGRVTQAEATTVETHLNSCPACFRELASLARNALLPATEHEKLEISQLKIFSPAEQVSNILEHCAPPRRPAEKASLAAIITAKVRRFIDHRIFNRYLWRPAIAVAALCILMVGIHQGTRYYRTTYQLVQAQKLLIENYRSYIGNARLSGGYAPSGISVLLGLQEKKDSYLDKAASRLIRALRNDPMSTLAKQLLAQRYIIEHQNDQADSVFALIGAELNQSAALSNDLGVLSFQKKDWKAAMIHFQSALEIDPNFIEAYYNLALVKRELGEYDAAISFLTIYLEHEANEGWRAAAQRLIKDFRREK